MMFFDKNIDNISLSISKSNSRDIESLKELYESLKYENSKLDNPIQYILINQSLHLDSGKAIAQASHAQEELFGRMIKYASKEKLSHYLECLLTNPRTTIILSIENKDEINKLSQYLDSCNILSFSYIDEYGPGYRLEPTALAVEYLNKDNPKLEIFKSFDLYKPEKDYSTIMKITKLREIQGFLNDDPLTPHLSNREFRRKMYERFGKSL